jgi:hypothetical protein
MNMLSFWDKYFDDGLEMWDSGLAVHLLRSIAGREAQRCLAALNKVGRKTGELIPKLLVTRFRATALQVKPEFGLDEINLLEDFDQTRIHPLPEERSFHVHSPRDLRTGIRKCFFEAAVRVFGKSTSAPAGERQFRLQLAPGFAWCPVVVAGRPTAQVVYWGAIEGLPPTISGLSILNQLGVAGSTAWDLIVSETQAAHAAAQAESIWRMEAERLTRLLL